jgi:hypothetical protein
MVVIDVPEVALVDVNYMCCVLSDGGWTYQLKLKMGMSCVCDVLLGGSWHVELHVHSQIAEHGQKPPVGQQLMSNLSMKEMGH